MDVNLGHFKHVFTLKSIYGLSTVSLDTLERNKLKVAYCSFIIIINAFELIVSIYDKNNDITNLPFMSTILNYFCLYLPLYSLVTAIVDYKSKVSIALNLEAIENRLDSIKMSVAGKSWFRVQILSLLVINWLIQGTYLVFNVFYTRPNGPITKYCTVQHFVGTILLQGGSMVLFLSKAVMIQRAITEGFSKTIRDQQALLAQQRPGNRRRRTVKSRTESYKWTLLAELQRSLEFTEHSIRDHFWVYITWYRLMVEVMGPAMGVLWLTESQKFLAGIFLAEIAGVFLGMVHAIVELNIEKENALSSLIEVEGKETCGNRLKHQILAKIHRSRWSFSSPFFTIDSFLLATVLENLVFVVTTMIGVYGKSG